MRVTQLKRLEQGVHHDAPPLAPTIMNRIDPVPSTAPERKEREIRAFADYLGEPWLSGRGHHPIRALWARDDWLATLEILSFGALIERLHGITPLDYLRKARNKLRAEELGQVAGTAFELELAGLLSCHDQQVQLAAPGQPGYDLTVAFTGGGQVAISCKALSASTSELSFLRLADHVYNGLLSTLMPGFPVELWMMLKQETDPACIDWVAAVRELLQCAGQIEGKMFLCSQDIGAVVRKAVPLGKNRFSPIDRSLSFVATQQMARDEQRRFESKIQKAVANMPRSSAMNRANAIAIKLPQWISDQRAALFVKSLFEDQRNDHIAAIILFRCYVMSGSDENSVLERNEFRGARRVAFGKESPTRVPNVRKNAKHGTSIGYSLKIFNNPKASVSLIQMAPRGLRFSIPYGHSVRGAESNRLVVGSKVFEIKDSYLYWRSDHVYGMAIAGRKDAIAIRPPFLPGLTASWTFVSSNNERVLGPVRLPGCPEDRLILL